MGLRAYLMIDVADDMEQGEFIKGLQELEEIPGVEVTGEEPLTEKSVHKFFKKADVIGRQKITLNRTIFISLKDY